MQLLILTNTCYLLRSAREYESGLFFFCPTTGIYELKITTIIDKYICTDKYLNLTSKITAIGRLLSQG